LAVSGLILGPIPTVVAMLIAAAYRGWLGGAGAVVGVAVIACSGGLGLLWRLACHGRVETLGWRQLYALGLVVNVVMLGLMLTLPGGSGRFVLAMTTIPVLVIYPLLTVALGLLLINQLHRQRSVEQLREQEAWFRSLFENNHSVMLLVNPDNGSIADANQAAERFYGWTRAQLTGMKIWDINSFSPAQVQEEMRLAKTQNRNHFEFTHRRADGSEVEVEVFSGPIRHGDEDYLYSIVHDISARKAAETALEESRRQRDAEEKKALTEQERARLAALNLMEDALAAKSSLAEDRQRLANILWGTGVGTWEWNIQTGEVRVNDKWAEFLGYTLEELEPITIATWVGLAHPEDLKRSNQVFEQHFAGKREYYECEVRMRHKAGHWIWVLDRGRLIDRTAAGEPQWTAGTHLDITERKQAEALTGMLSRRSRAQLMLPEARDEMSEIEFVQYAQELAEDLTGSQMSCIHFVNDDEQTIELVTWSRRTLEHYCNVDQETDYQASKAGVWTDSLRQRGAVIINDYAGHQNKRGLPKEHAALARMLSVPVFEDGKVVMLAGVGNKEGDYEPADVETVQLLSNDIWRLVQRRRGVDA
ncbi:MAG: PAS domain S-box protein, partial [Haliea sp.]